MDDFNTSSNSNALVKNIYKELECPVCLELFHKPVNLSCSHTLCSSHINEMVSEDTIKCPMCNFKTSTKDWKFPINYIAQSIANLLNEEERVECGGCENETPVGSCYFCMDCNAILCPLCYTNAHKNSPLKFMRTHSVISYAEKKLQQQTPSSRPRADTQPLSQLQSLQSAQQMRPRADTLPPMLSTPPFIADVPPPPPPGSQPLPHRQPQPIPQRQLPPIPPRPIPPIPPRDSQVAILRQRQPAVPQQQGERYGTIKYNYHPVGHRLANGESDISVSAGERCKVLGQPSTNGWVRVEVNQRIGVVPFTYVHFH